MNSSFFFFFLFFFLNSLLQQNKNQYSTYILTQWLTQFQCEKYRVVFVGQSQSHPTLNRISSLWRRFESTSSHKQTAAFQEELIYFCHAFPTADWDKVDCRGKEMSPTLTLLFLFYCSITYAHTPPLLSCAMMTSACTWLRKPHILI